MPKRLQRVWRSILGGLSLLLAGGASVGEAATGYFYWSGEQALLPSGSPAVKECKDDTTGPILCYPKFAADGTTRAVFNGFVPADILTGGASLGITCNLFYAPIAGTDTDGGTVRFETQYWVFPSGNGISEGNSSSPNAWDETVGSNIPAWQILASSLAGSQSMSYSGDLCPTDTTCVGKPMTVRLSRLGDADLFADAVLVTGVLCTYLTAS